VSKKKTQFTGVWVPERIISDKRLTVLEKLIASYVVSLCVTTDGCYASNEHLAKIFNVSTVWASNVINKLIKLEYCFLEKFDGRRRILRTKFGMVQSAEIFSFKPEDNAALNCSLRQPQTTVEPYNKENNKKDNNTSSSIGTEAKKCVDYHFKKTVETVGIRPTIAGATEINLFKILLRDHDMQCVNAVQDYFFAYKKRRDFTVKTFYNRFDVLYGKMQNEPEEAWR